MTLAIIARGFAAIFAFLVISKTLLSYKQKKETKIMTAFWLSTWIMVLVFAFYPGIINRVFGDNKTGIGTLLGTGLVFLYFIIYRVYAKVDRVERQLHTLTRALSIKELEKGEKKKR